MKKTLTFLLILSSIIGFSQTKPTDPGFKSLITPRAVTFWWDAENSDPWMQSSYLGTAPNTWVKLWTATKIQVKLDSLANAKQDTLTLTTAGTGAATLIGSTLNIPISSGILPDSLKEDKVNKENTTVDNSTTKYPTVNLLKTYAAPLSLFGSLTSGYVPYWDGTKFINGSIQTDGTYYSFGTSPVPGYRIFAVGNMRALGELEAYSGAYNGNGTNNSQIIASFGKGGYSNGFQVRYNGSTMEYEMLDGNLKIVNLASTNPRLLSTSSTGQLTPIADGNANQILQTDGDGNYSWVDFMGNTPAQILLSATTVDFNYLSGSNAILILSSNVTNLSFINTHDGAQGDILVIEDATGGYGITNIIQSGLTSIYPDPDGDNSGNKPVASNINSGSNRKTIISYHRIGSYLNITYGNFAQ